MRTEKKPNPKDKSFSEILKHTTLYGETQVDIAGVPFRFVACGGVLDFAIEFPDGRVIFSSDYAERVYGRDDKGKEAKV